MHLYAPVIGIDLGALLEHLKGPERVVGHQMIFGIVAHGAIRVQLSSDRNSLAGALHRSSVSSWRTVLQTLGDPRSAERQIVPRGREAGRELRDPVEDRHELCIRKLRVPESRTAAEIQPQRWLREACAAAPGI